MMRTFAVPARDTGGRGSKGLSATVSDSRVPRQGAELGWSCPKGLHPCPEAMLLVQGRYLAFLKARRVGGTGKTWVHSQAPVSYRVAQGALDNGQGEAGSCLQAGLSGCKGKAWGLVAAIRKWSPSCPAPLPSPRAWCYLYSRPRGMGEGWRGEGSHSCRLSPKEGGLLPIYCATGTEKKKESLSRYFGKGILALPVAWSKVGED